MSQIFAIRAGRTRKGFSFVELSVVIGIIGVLAAFGVPRFFKSVERSKASEAFRYLNSVRVAQERYHARQDTYADDVTKLDMAQTPPTDFTVGVIRQTENSWSCTLTRSGASVGLEYNVIFTEDGFDATSTIPDDLNPHVDAG